MNVYFEFSKVKNGKFASRYDGYMAINIGRDFSGTILSGYNRNFACDHCPAILEIRNGSNKTSNRDNSI